MTPYDIVESEVLAATSLEESAKALEHLISGGFAVWDDGSLYSIKQLVGSVKGLRIEIFAREHPPPHFHVSGGGIDAMFSLVDGSHLEGEVSGRDRRLVEWWYRRSRLLLVETWNQTRPENCPVGPIEE